MVRNFNRACEMKSSESRVKQRPRASKTGVFNMWLISSKCTFNFCTHEEALKGAFALANFFFWHMALAIILVGQKNFVGDETEW